MRKIYIAASAVIIALGIALAILPEKKSVRELAPETLLRDIIDQTRYISADELAHKIISGDPSILIIDVRNPDEYNRFSLPGAVNIPFDSILNPDNEAYFDQDYKINILYSNGGVYANQAWMLLRRKGYERIYVLDGGLNNWFETIIKPKYPEQPVSNEEKELYDFRKAASMFFTGGTPSESADASKPKVSVPVKRKKNQDDTGGC